MASPFLEESYVQFLNFSKKENYVILFQQIRCIFIVWK